ncbi:DUF1499 domain-containing protein [Texcoconibacillus texcoconensis]|uniref:DUF1499 domain-containing protein n=1 Tax=Texcoconibacillus texcoconensis TaxID=1095777 RepID=A0A840QMZ8_9BACI|nr:DUF1499 domain-containing protein [Texcoconibacillus texcoconensis]MBB5172710.1 hypothetical protein [Texcoconibacillus texcoconensis]
MGIIQSLKRFFSKQTETSEKNHDQALQSHYYKMTKDKTFRELENFFSEKEGFEIRSVSEEHGEMIVKRTKGKPAFIVVTIIMVRPFRTSVDFSVASETMLFTDFGSSRRLIYGLYEELNQRLTFVGTGLGDELAK